MSKELQRRRCRICDKEVPENDEIFPLSRRFELGNGFIWAHYICAKEILTKYKEQ
eukprot:Pgem_evm1s15432